MSTILFNDQERRIYDLSIAQKYDPERAVFAHRVVAKISDTECRAHQRRLLTGVVLPIDPEDKDIVDFTTYSKAIADQIEAARRQVESWVEHYYEKTAPGLMGAHLLFGAESRLRQIVAKALAAYHNYFTDPAYLPKIYVGGSYSGPIVYATSRPGERFLIRRNRTFDSVAEDLKNDIWCDLDINGNGHCIRAMRYTQENMQYCENIEINTSLLFPFAVGDMVIFARFCRACWTAFAEQEKIIRQDCKIFSPFADGFGEVG
ncbi:hypothetical protein MSIMFI_03773 [Mycobacterium simulans]|uniref:hypothetical protein n=1 Tax=Mycobacterium simulans TaxID=627089 RepID=UPI001748BDFF|nr:hypothetical protein [Mycobacterium simulans]SON62252.1 hypothetical protein MSIMFI_03773 [Mycobacterium simulans]